MKRRILAVILICVGVAGLLLLPWEYTLFENEDYRITQTATGGKATLYSYEALMEVPWDNIISGVHSESMDKVVEKLLSGTVSGNELIFAIASPEVKFPGLDKIRVPQMPSGYIVSGNAFWSVRGYSYSFRSTKVKASGSISYCFDSENCRDCRYFDDNYKSYSDNDTVNCYKLINGAKVIRQSNSIRMKGTDNGVNFHLDMSCNPEKVSDLTLCSFGAKRYFSTHPKMLMVYAINAGHGLGAVATLAGIGLLVYPLLRKKKEKSAAEE